MSLCCVHAITTVIKRWQPLTFKLELFTSSESELFACQEYQHRNESAAVSSQDIVGSGTQSCITSSKCQMSVPYQQTQL